MKVGIEGIHLNTLKVIYDKPPAHSQYNTQQWNAESLPTNV